ncbi:MAG: phosphatidylserine decarboxylase family protein [Bacteroidales bacterium]|nr:phosphatidylserine decarboxylase family protein [Bacteroidales bacterium]
MTIHKEGFTTISVIFAFLALASFATLYLIPNTLAILQYGLIVAYFIFWLFIISFFRYPKRIVNRSENSIIAPADGKIVVIEEIEEKEYFKDRRMQVSIFMSPLNVHANWYPISGDITYTKYHSGKHIVANHPKSSTDNERTTVVVKHRNGTEIMFRQVAGALARRIVCYSQTGEKVEQGNNFGFIKFGSRVDIILPLNTAINVVLDELTVAQQTVIANFL